MWWCSHRWQSVHDKLPWWAFSCPDTQGGMESLRHKVERWRSSWHQGEHLCKTAQFPPLYFGGQCHFPSLIILLGKRCRKPWDFMKLLKQFWEAIFLKGNQNLMQDRLYSVDWILYCSLKAQAVTNVRSDYIVKSLLLLFLVGNTSFS